MTAIEHPPYADFIESGGEPIRPGFYRTRRSGDGGWVEIEIKPDPTGKGEFVAVDGAGRAVNAETVWTRCVNNPSTREAFAATKPKVYNTTEVKAMELQSAEIGEIAAALAKAQADLTNVPRNREVDVVKDGKKLYSFTYATLDAILDMVRPILSANGMAVVQSIMPSGKLVVVTTLAHSSGQWLRSYLPIESGSSSQAIGSAISYAKRYALTAMLGIAAEDDDDANMADGNTVKKLTPIPPPARPKPEPEPDAQRIAKFWAGQDFKVPKLRLSWQEWQAKMISAISSAPDAAALGQLMADNAYELDGLKAEVPKAHAVLSAAAAARFPKGK